MIGRYLIYDPSVAMQLEPILMGNAPIASLWATAAPTSPFVTVLTSENFDAAISGDKPASACSRDSLPWPFVITAPGPYSFHGSHPTGFFLFDPCSANPIGLFGVRVHGGPLEMRRPIRLACNQNNMRVPCWCHVRARDTCSWHLQ
jgi:hypothetical protein